MKVIKPTPVTDASLSGSSLPETDYPAWASGTAYAAPTRVLRAHRIYEAIAASTGADPTTSPTKWLSVGPTNRWAMFDQAVGTLSTGTGTITVALAPTDIVGSLAIVDTDAETVRVQVTLAGTTIYDTTKTTNVGGAVISDWLGYFTAETGKVMALTFLDLPMVSSAQITVTITGVSPSLPVSVGTFILGTLIDLGSTEAGANVSILDFSRKETDEFGVTTVVERPWAKRMTVRSLIETRAVDSTQRNLAALRAKPALWIGEESTDDTAFDALTVYGFFKEFSIDLALANISYCSLTIEGLI